MKGEIRDYCEMKFQPNDWHDLITKVYLGPKNRSNLKVVKDYLDANGLTKTDVMRSAAFYR